VAQSQTGILARPGICGQLSGSFKPNLSSLLNEFLAKALKFWILLPGSAFASLLIFQPLYALKLAGQLGERTKTEEWAIVRRENVPDCEILRFETIGGHFFNTWKHNQAMFIHVTPPRIHDPGELVGSLLRCTGLLRSVNRLRRPGRIIPVVVPLKPSSSAN
jgi:hypothetical protein